MITITPGWLAAHDACFDGVDWATPLLPPDGLTVDRTDLTALWALAVGEQRRDVREYAAWAAQQIGGLVLRDADLRGAVLTGAVLRGADLTGAVGIGRQL
jgi:hypothetical protein